MSLDTIPREMLRDIVMVFLLGVGLEHKDPQTGLRHNLIRHLEVDLIVEWKDLFSLRKPIIDHLKRSDNELVVSLANSMEGVHSSMAKGGV